MHLNSFFKRRDFNALTAGLTCRSWAGTGGAICTLVLMVLSPAQAAKKYTLYQCGSQTNLDNCTQTCVQANRYDPITIEVIPREMSGEVIAKKHILGGIVASTFKGCSIFDEESWNCKEEIDIGDLHLVIKNALTNELYTSIEVASNRRVTSSCAKPNP